MRIAIDTGSYGDYVGLGLVKIRDWSRDLVHAVGSGASRLNDEQQRLRPCSGSPRFGDGHTDLDLLRLKA